MLMYIQRKMRVYVRKRAVYIYVGICMYVHMCVLVGTKVYTYIPCMYVHHRVK